jgi:threonyl-tRNA synthetase
MAPVDRDDSSYKLRHSTAHVMAQAIKEMFPEAKLAWGAATRQVRERLLLRLRPVSLTDARGLA